MKTPIHLLMVSFWKSEYVEKIEMCIMKLTDSGSQNSCGCV